MILYRHALSIKATKFGPKGGLMVSLYIPCKFMAFRYMIGLTASARVYVLIVYTELMFLLINIIYLVVYIDDQVAHICNDDAICDIYDGEVFKELAKPPNFLSANTNTGLIMSTDGVPVFKSSKGSMWPVYLCLTSIPPDKRMKLKNIIIAGLWFGVTKPDMKVLLNSSHYQ